LQQGERQLRALPDHEREVRIRRCSEAFLVATGPKPPSAVPPQCCGELAEEAVHRKCTVGVIRRPTLREIQI
jgi:hypothetical protein